MPSQLHFVFVSTGGIHKYKYRELMVESAENGIQQAYVLSGGENSFIAILEESFNMVLLASQAKRAYFDIVAHMLAILSSEPHSKTKLSGKAKLDSRGLQRYLQVLIKSRLVYLERENLLAITPKGKEFLQQYERLKLYLED